MNAMIDARCSRCGAHVGWSGGMRDRPACRRCGHRPPQSELDAAQAEMDAFRNLLAAIDEARGADPDWPVWGEARRLAGLTLRQAAKLLDVTPSSLSEIEQGRCSPVPALADRMCRLYRGEDVEVGRGRD